MKRNLYLIILLLLILPLCGVAKNITTNAVIYKGGIVRLDPSRKNIVLAFTCADMADGAEKILSVLKQERIKAAFFLTGSFMNKYPQHVYAMKKQHHYVGSHSYGHLLYSSWDEPDKTTVSKDEFNEDLKRSFDSLAVFGIKQKDARFFMPPYEHYNETISTWAKEIGLQVINFTAGSTSNADYTTPDMKNYRSSETIYNNVINLEEKEGLNGHILLFHIGTVNARTDKFYNKHLEKLINELKLRGYKFLNLK